MILNKTQAAQQGINEYKNKSQVMPVLTLNLLKFLNGNNNPASIFLTVHKLLYHF